MVRAVEGDESSIYVEFHEATSGQLRFSGSLKPLTNKILGIQEPLDEADPHFLRQKKVVAGFHVFKHGLYPELGNHFLRPFQNGQATPFWNVRQPGAIKFDVRPNPSWHRKKTGRLMSPDRPLLF